MHRTQRGFTLVELSIVLVILGLLVGGVLTGQSLIRAAELRAITTEFDKYQTAVQTFRDKYFAIPGDMTNAVAFWPTAANGNGDGIINSASAASLPGEIFGFWQQLAFAGLVEGTYTGLSGGGSAFDTMPGTNSPKSRVSSAGWGVYYQAATMAGDTAAYTYDYGNTFVFGGTSPGSLPYTATLRPEEAWNVDTKMDDGKPGSGKLIVRYWNNACSTASSMTDYASPYNLGNATLQCALYFTRAF